MIQRRPTSYELGSVSAPRPSEHCGTETRDRSRRSARSAGLVCFQTLTRWRKIGRRNRPQGIWPRGVEATIDRSRTSFNRGGRRGR